MIGFLSFEVFSVHENKNQVSYSIEEQLFLAQRSQRTFQIFTETRYFYKHPSVWVMKYVDDFHTALEGEQGVCLAHA